MSSIEKDTLGSVSLCVLCTTVRSAWTLLLAELVDTGVTRIAVGNVKVDWDWACDWNRAYPLLLIQGYVLTTTELHMEAYDEATLVHYFSKLHQCKEYEHVCYEIS